MRVCITDLEPCSVNLCVVIITRTKTTTKQNKKQKTKNQELKPALASRDHRFIPLDYATNRIEVVFVDAIVAHLPCDYPL